MSDPILLFLGLDVIALLLAAALTATVPTAAAFVTTLCCGLGALLCLPPLLLPARPTALDIPIGPPGLSLHLALDPLSVFFLVVVLLAATAIAAIQATTHSPSGPPRMTACCVAGIELSLLSADGVTLAIGLTLASIALWQPKGRTRIPVPLLAPVLLLAAICLLTPPGYAPRFDAIRTAPIDPDRALAAIMLSLAAVAALAWPHRHPRSVTRDTLTAGLLVPAGCYLLLRVIADLCGPAPQAWWGVLVLLAGGLTAVVQGWLSAAAPDIDTAIAALVRRQAALAATTIGLSIIARAADLAGSATFALQAACLTATAAAIAGTLVSLAAHAIGDSAGLFRLSRLGGLIHTMPATCAALGGGLLTLSALPPSLGFAALWLAFQSILSAPRTGGLLPQLPLALAAAAIALSAALATAASVRIAGIAILGRPRTPRGAGARESLRPVRNLLLTLAGASLLAGLLPGPLLWALADPAILAMTEQPPGRSTDLVLLSVSGASTGYLPLPVFAILILAAGAVALLRRRSRREAKVAGPWLDGFPPSIGLPFGEPAAQSAGAGFLTTLPTHALRNTSWLRARPPSSPPLVSTSQPSQPGSPLPSRLRAISPTAGIWLILAAFAAVLLALAITA